jgi:hypothetical protein
MKKLFLSLAVAGMFAFVACGPSEAEKAEQARLDSLKQDSIAKVQADSLAAIVEQAKADSIAKALEQAKADSIAAAAKKGGRK